MQEWVKARYPKDPSDTDFVYRQSIKAKALDALRGMLPAASLSNVGIYGTGQGYEALLLRMRAHPLPEARAYAAMMLEELRKVIPSFLARVDKPDRGGAWSDYFESTRSAMEDVAGRLFAGEEAEPRPAVTLVDFDPDAEDKLLAAMLYPFTDLPEDQVLARVRRLSAGERAAVALAFRLRYSIQMNAREVLHMLELRTQAAGHPEYRRVCQEMHRLIAEQAGHPLVAELMRFVDHGTYDLERLEGERRAEARRFGR